MNQQQLEDIAKQASAAVSVEFYGLECIPNGDTTLYRIYIDSPSGVSIDDCVLANRQIAALLDVAGVDRLIYDLEVSSPGITRRIFYPHQYVVGQLLDCNLLTEQLDSRKLRGKLAEVSADGIVLVVYDQRVNIAFGNIERAQTIVEQ